MSGGRRNGAGRRKGVPNKSTAARQAALAASGKTPLDFMLERLNDPQLEAKERMHAAVVRALVWALWRVLPSNRSEEVARLVETELRFS